MITRDQRVILRPWYGSKTQNLELIKFLKDRNNDPSEILIISLEMEKPKNGT